jgi:hypothetical protein
MSQPRGAREAKAIVPVGLSLAGLAGGPTAARRESVRSEPASARRDRMRPLSMSEMGSSEVEEHETRCRSCYFIPGKGRLSISSPDQAEKAVADSLSFSLSSFATLRLCGRFSAYPSESFDRSCSPFSPRMRKRLSRLVWPDISCI